MLEGIRNRFLRVFLLTLISLLVSSLLCFSAFSLFHSLYFKQVFVAGDSMNPTLRGDTSTNGAEFGIIDCHNEAIRTLKRFDIVTCYYSFEDYIYQNGEYYQKGDKLKDNATYKIKRVIGLPGDTITIENNNLFITTKGGRNLAYGDGYTKFPFKRNLLGDNVKPIENYHLDDNCYWVMGDNWSNSHDCGSVKKHIYKENIVGVLVAIEGYCTIKGDNCVNRHYANIRFY